MLSSTLINFTTIIPIIITATASTEMPISTSHALGFGFAVIVLWQMAIVMNSPHRPISGHNPTSKVKKHKGRRRLGGTVPTYTPSERVQSKKETEIIPQVTLVLRKAKEAEAYWRHRARNDGFAVFQSYKDESDSASR